MLKGQRTTARSRLVSTLAGEILDRASEGSFAIESEHQLCRRFNISRVTVRLALSDLEARGLIFRRHGKGTFAYGRLNRVRRSIGVLLKCIPGVPCWPISEMIRGFQSGAVALRANVLLIHSSPQEWSPEMLHDLGGVIVFSQGVSPGEMECLHDMKLPTLFAWESELSGPFVDFNQIEMARMMAERLFLGGHEHIALVSGFEKSLDALKREGINQALKSIGKNPEQLVEYSISEDERDTRDVFDRFARHVPHFSAAIATDDGIAVRLIEYLRSHTAICVPATMSVASFHRSPFLTGCLPLLSTADFDFFSAGKQAVEALSRASLTGESVEVIRASGELIEGGTIGERAFSR